MVTTRSRPRAETNVIKKFFDFLPFASKLFIVLSNDLSNFEPFLILKKAITSLSKLEGAVIGTSVIAEHYTKL